MFNSSKFIRVKEINKFYYKMGCENFPLSFLDDSTTVDNGFVFFSVQHRYKNSFVYGLKVNLILSKTIFFVKLKINRLTHYVPNKTSRKVTIVTLSYSHIFVGALQLFVFLVSFIQ